MGLVYILFQIGGVAELAPIQELMNVYIVSIGFIGIESSYYITYQSSIVIKQF